MWAVVCICCFLQQNLCCSPVYGSHCVLPFALASHQAKGTGDMPSGGHINVLQAAAGALEELRRSTTPEDDQAAEEAAVPMLVPTKRGKRSRSTHPAAASASSQAAAVAAAAALAEGPADTAQKPSGPSSSVPARTRRLSAKGRAAASKTDSADLGSARSSGANAELATASGQSNASGSSIAVVTDGAGVQSQPEAAADDAEKQHSQRQSGSKARGKSRLSRASSPVQAPVVESDHDALPVKRRTSIKRSAAGGTAAGADPVRKKRSGTASSATQAGAGKADVSAHAQAEPKSGPDDKAAAGTGAGDDGTRASAKGSGARRKSAPSTGPEAAPAASETAAGSSRRGSRGRAASQGANAVAAAEVAAAPAGRAKRSRPSSDVLPDVSASDANAADDMEQAGPSSSKVEEGAAGGGGTGHDPAKGPSGPKASKGKRRRQDMAEPQEDSPASHVKAARKATDNRYVLSPSTLLQQQCLLHTNPIPHNRHSNTCKAILDCCIALAPYALPGDDIVLSAAAFAPHSMRLKCSAAQSYWSYLFNTLLSGPQL